MLDDLGLDQIRQQPEMQTLLKIYFDLQVQGREQSKDFDGWVPRLVDAESIAPETLPGLHGKLIAFGFVKFDVSGRDAGIRYQLTPLGRQAILGKNESEEESADGEMPVSAVA